jgi:O-antigen/teichoic acid export membrane protein
MRNPSVEPHPQRPFAPQFIESVVLTWAGNVLRVVVGLVALRVVTSSVPEHELGAYWILTTVAALLSTFGDLGVGLAAVRHLPLASSAEQRQRLMQTTLVVRATFLVLVCLAVLAFKPWVLKIFDASAIGDRYHYVYIFVVLTSLFELHTNFLQGLNRFRIIAAVALGSSAVRLALILVFVSVMDLGIAGLFAAEAVAIAASLVVSARASGYGLRLRARRDEAKQHLGFGLPLYVNMLLAYTATRLNMLMVGSFSGPTAVSHFTVASRIPDQISMMLRAYNSVFLPNMTRLTSEPGMQRAQRLLTASLRVMSYGFALGTLTLSFFRKELLHVLAPDSYQSAAAALPLLLGGITFASLGGVMGLTIVALGDSRTPMKINVWTTLFSVVLNVILIPRWGFMGAAWALFAFNVFGCAVTERVLARRLSPQSYGYLLVLLAWLGAYALGHDATLLLRLGIIAAFGLGPLAVSGALREDMRRILAARRTS